MTTFVIVLCIVLIWLELAAREPTSFEVRRHPVSGGLDSAHELVLHWQWGDRSAWLGDCIEKVALVGPFIDWISARWGGTTTTLDIMHGDRYRARQCTSDGRLRNGEEARSPLGALASIVLVALKAQGASA
ncbi:MAG TPA: hypothetical protein VHN99_00650 [Deinococcales bacterium]|nr:hypothetical protein [Deinococcales bacterium]